MSKTAAARHLATMRFAGVLSFLLLAALAAPLSAEATWSAPITLSPAGVHSSGPQLGMDQNGNSVFVWVESHLSTGSLIRARARSAAGPLSAIQTLSGPGSVGQPQVAVDPNGNAVFDWPLSTCDENCVGLRTRARSAGGALSSVQTIADPSADVMSESLGIDQNGNSVFVWQTLYPEIQARVRSSTGTLSQVQTLSFGFVPQVAVEPDGSALFVWYVADDPSDVCGGRRCNHVQLVTRSANGRFGKAETISARGQDAANPQIGVDRSGNAVIGWDVGQNPGSAIQTRARSAKGKLSAIQTISTSPFAQWQLQLAVDPNGNAVFAWPRYDQTTSCDPTRGCLRIQARARSAAGVFGSIQTLSPAGQDSDQQQVAVDGGANAVFVWRRWDGANYTVQARTRSAAGVLGAVQTLSAAGLFGPPDVAADPAGSAVATWARYDGTGTCSPAGCVRIQAAVGP